MPVPDSATLHPDLCIIGGGSAGFTVASGAGALGVPTVLIDKSGLDEALPRALDLVWQSLAAAAERRAHARGLVTQTTADWKALVRAAKAMAEAVAPDMSAARLRALGVTVIAGTARFANAHTVEAAGRLIKARRFIVATGASPKIPAIAGLELVPVLTRETILDLPGLPEHLLILGGGETGVALAQCLARLGAKVAVFDRGPILGSLDAELRAPLLARLGADGVALHSNQRIARIEPLVSGIRLWVEGPPGSGSAGNSFEGSHLLAATGWAPNIAEWRPEAAGIALEAGRLVLGRSARTSNRRVQAIGAVAEAGASIQAAQRQGALALRSALFRLSFRLDPTADAQVIGTDPAIARVGLDEAAARARAGRIRVLRAPYAMSFRGRAEGVHEGHVKIVTSARGRVLGAAIIGREAGESIGLWTLAIAKGLKIGDIARLGLPVSSFTDLSRRAALSNLTRDFGKPRLRWLLGLLRRLG